MLRKIVNFVIIIAVCLLQSGCYSVYEKLPGEVPEIASNTADTSAGRGKNARPRDEESDNGTVIVSVLLRSGKYIKFEEPYASISKDGKIITGIGSDGTKITIKTEDVEKLYIRQINSTNTAVLTISILGMLLITASLLFIVVKLATFATI